MERNWSGIMRNMSSAMRRLWRCLICRNSIIRDREIFVQQIETFFPTFFPTRLTAFLSIVHTDFKDVHMNRLPFFAFFHFIYNFVYFQNSWVFYFFALFCKSIFCQILFKNIFLCNEDDGCSGPLPRRQAGWRVSLNGSG